MGTTINPMGKDIIKVTTQLCGRELSLEVGRVGFRTTASVIVRYGDTVILGTAMVSPKTIQGMDYFPLSIDYEEKMYAAGKISGSRFVKREGRPSEDAILIGRLIDRPLRPLWPKGYRNEVQCVATVLSMDPSFRPDMVAMIASSTALLMTGAPFDGPVAGLRVGMVDGGYKAFLSTEESNASKLDLVVAGVESGVMMVEAGASEVTEQEVIDAIAFAQEAYQPAIKLQQELVAKMAVVKQEYTLVLPNEDIQKEVSDWAADRLGKAVRATYPKRNDNVAEVRTAMHEFFIQKLGAEVHAEHKHEYDEAFTLAVHKDVRKGIIEESIRPDGRSLTEVRPLSSEIGILPRTHGSSLFTRGLTQALNIVTLAPLSYAQMIDTMEFETEKRYMHHYNAPGYTVGEIKRLSGPGRREIGHSALAERAVLAVLPSTEVFPYAIRSVTETMSQNGSSSMAATCSSILALMDAGVPILRPVSGIAMGLMLEGDKPYIMSDIADAEDFAGDMDFKVTGTVNGITALQMDMKVHGLKVDILREALMQGKEGRAHILEHMLTTIAQPKPDLSPYAPRVEAIKINPEKIGAVIGKGGEMINRITKETGAEIDIKEDGTVNISSPDGESIAKAREWIIGLTAEPEVGKVYENARVVSVLDFGAFVEFMPGQEGLVHVSELSDQRVNSPSDVVKVGDTVAVKLLAIDDKGRNNLSMKAVPKK